MAFMRSLSTRSTLTKRKYRPSSFTYFLHEDDHKNHVERNYSSKPLISPINQSIQQQRSFNSTGLTLSLFFQDSHLAGASFVRYMSSTTTTASEKMDDVAEVLMDSITQAAPIANEVAIAATDSFFTIAVLQHAVDAVHNFTGLNWWASIAVSALIMRSAMLPLSIYQLKTSSKLSIVKPRLDEIKEKMESQGMDYIESRKQMKKLFKEHGVSPYTPVMGLLIQAPISISFFLAVMNMAEKVPSFKSGGAFWFVDLSTPDDLYIFPVLAALTFLTMVECNMQEGMEGNLNAGKMKIFSRCLAFASVPLTMNFPKAVFCYWVTANLFSLVYGLVLKAPGVKQFLGVPEVPQEPPTTNPKSSSFDISSALKLLSKAREQRISSPAPAEPPKLLMHKKSSSSSEINKRVRKLEKEVKGRKKNKKR